jgi:hypothetical protein
LALLVETWDAADEDDSKYEVLQSKSREQRLAAVEQFPSLLDALIEAAENEVERVSKSSDSIDALIGSIKSGTKP